MKRRLLLGITLAAAAPSIANAQEVPAVLSLSARDTLDLWANVSGGKRTGFTELNKLQLGGTLATDRLGLNGFSVHVQLFRTDGSSLSEKVGDIQTVDSIDARPVTRLFESWVEQKVGDDNRSFAVRVGLMDLNADYDSIQTSSLFVNSSQGIGADVARSGLNGPSIYPVSSLGVRISWLPNKRWTFRIAAFDGVPGDLDHPRAFVSAKLSSRDGALLIGQTDYHLSEKAKIEAGAWRYSTFLAAVSRKALTYPDQGAYISVEGPLPHLDKLSAWMRLGVADSRAQSVTTYLGAGLVAQDIVPGRPNDRLGLAVARAMIGEPARRAARLPSAETDFELSYQLKIQGTFAVQPDLQYVVHPASEPHIGNALVFGIRFVLTAGYPKKAPATEATDPTVPPDGPQPTDDTGAADNS